QYSFGGIPFLFLGTNQIIFIIIILLYIFSGMAFASLSSETSLGVKVMEGNGKLPKVVLSSVDESGGIPHCFPQFGPGAIKQVQFIFLFYPFPYLLLMCHPLVTKRRLQLQSFIQGQYLSTTSIYYPMWLLNLYSHLTRNCVLTSLYSFQVILSTSSLSTVLIVTNIDNRPFSFSSALHTYFRVRIQFSYLHFQIVFF
ncbi:hypothetical protein IFM89_029023, partial [Coptis chinensis]